MQRSEASLASPLLFLHVFFYANVRIENLADQQEDCCRGEHARA